MGKLILTKPLVLDPLTRLISGSPYNGSKFNFGGTDASRSGPAIVPLRDRNRYEEELEEENDQDEESTPLVSGAFVQNHDH